MSSPSKWNSNHSLYGATANTELYSLDSPAVRKDTGPLHAISEDKVVIGTTDVDAWTEGITYYSLDQMRADNALFDAHSDLNAAPSPQRKRLSPLYMAVFNMLAGCGLVGVPIQYLHADGIIMGVAITLLVSLASIYTMRLLVYTGIKLDCQDYERLVSHCWGMYGYYFISLSILLFDTGACITYTIILGNCAQDVMQYIFSSEVGTDENRQIFIVLVYVCIILPLCVGKNFRFIEKVQVFGIAIYIFLVLVVIYRYYDEYQYHTETTWKLLYDDERRGLRDWIDILNAFGAITFSLIQHDVAFLVYKTVKNQTYLKFSILCFCGTGIQCALCILLCVYGYISFGEDMHDDILRNYQKRYPLIMCIRVFYMVRMAVIFPTAFYVVRHVLFAMLYTGYDCYEDTTFPKKCVFTLIPLTVFLVLGLYIRNLSNVMTLFGLLAAINISFVVPCLCFLKEGRNYPILFWQAPPGRMADAIKETAPSVFLIVIGVFATVFGSVEFLYRLTSKFLQLD